MRLIGLQTSDGSFFSQRSETLTDLNDSGKTFAEIADIIDSEPEGLCVAEETE
jgi:hypothetical protein